MQAWIKEYEYKNVIDKWKKYKMYERNKKYKCEYI